jgi:hypothetical protein
VRSAVEEVPTVTEPVTSAVPDVAGLPAVRWPGPTQVDLVADIPAAGVFLGTDRSGKPAALPILQPRPVRVGMLGAPAVSAVLAYRLLAVGCQLTVITYGTPYWANLYSKVGTGRLAIYDRPRQWPPAPAGPPGSSQPPQVLLLDYPTPPPHWLGEGPWCAVVHASATLPPDSEFWGAVDAMLLTSPGYAAAASWRWRHPDAALADDLRPGEIALADRDGTYPITFPLAQAEREIVG